MENLEKTKEQLIVELENLQKESEERYRAIFNLSPIAIEIYDSTGALVQVNKSCLKLFGIEGMEEIQGFSLFADPNINEEYKEKLFRGENVRYQGPFDFEKVKALNLYPTSRNGTIWLDVLVTPLRISAEQNKGYLIQIQDITEQKQTEEALRRSEEEFRSFYNEAPVGLYRTTPNGQILLANRAIFEMLGFSTIEELSARNLKQTGFGPTYSREQFIRQIEKDGEVKDLEAKWIRSDGEVIIVLENSKAVRDSHQKTLYYEGSVEDITRRKRTEEALQETEKKYEQMVSNINDVVYSVDAETGEFTYLSPVFGKLLGYTQEDIARMGGRIAFLSQVLPTGKFSEHQDRITQLRAKPVDKAVTDELWWRCKDGSMKCMADHWNPVYNDNLLVSTDGVLRDITESKQAEEALNELLVRAEASDRLKTAFMNNISHEVRTPLNGILGFAEVLDDPDMTPEDMAFYKEVLHMSSDRLLNTINSYMDISLIVSGNMSFSNSLFDLRELLSKKYDYYHDLAAAKGIAFKMDLSDDQGSIFLNSDPEFIRKVLDHLLENAVKFTEYGTILVGYRILPDEIEVYVQDSGIGISEKLQDQIFDSFLQGDFSNTRKHEGSGLGLAIAKGLIELLGGKIWVKSIENSGSTFGFTIPFIHGPAAIPVNESAAEQPAAANNPIVLIAEDDQINILLLETMLKKIKAMVWHVENGRLAVDCCLRHPEVSLVLMDLKMPEMDGFEATRQIKAIRKDLPVIAVTAFAMPGDRERALAAGCDDYLSKPFNAEMLKNKLVEYIRL